MPTKTLLEATQDVVSSIAGDNINSINDTSVSIAVARIIQGVFYEIISDRDWPTHRTLIQLEGPSSSTTPTHLKLPSKANYIEWVKYNIRKISDTKDDWQKINYLTPEDFVDLCMVRDSSDSNTLSVTDPGGTPLFILTNQMPTYWTTFDDEYIVMDSYHKDTETTLQKSKTMCYGALEPDLSLSDTATIDLPPKAMTYLIEESKSVAWMDIKQQANPKHEQASRRQRIWLARNKSRTSYGINRPDYGRK